MGLLGSVHMSKISVPVQIDDDSIQILQLILLNLTWIVRGKEAPDAVIGHFSVASSLCFKARRKK